LRQPVSVSAFTRAVAVDVGGAGGLLGHPVFVLVPELAHRDVRGAERLERIDPRRPAVAGFGEQLEAVPVEDFAAMREVVFDQEVADQFLIVVPEARGEVPAADLPAGQDRQPWHRIVAVALFKLLLEAVGPIDRVANLVAVEHQHLERAEAVAAAADGVEDVVEMRVGGLAAQVVDQQAVEFGLGIMRCSPLRLATKRRMLHSPAGTDQVSRPSAARRPSSRIAAAGSAGRGPPPAARPAAPLPHRDRGLFPASAGFRKTRPGR
jgi:hypothetical protein